MVFVFDLDDTISLTDRYSEMYINEFFINYKFRYKQIAKQARFAEQLFDWDDETARFWYKEFGDEMMLEFPAKAGAVSTINGLHDAGHRIVIATKRSKTWHTDPVGVTKRWLRDIGIKYDKLYIGDIDKLQVCDKECADVFVDDDLTEVKTILKLLGGTGTRVFLASSDYNKTKPTPLGVERLDRMNDLPKKLGLNDDLRVD